MWDFSSNGFILYVRGVNQYGNFFKCTKLLLRVVANFCVKVKPGMLVDYIIDAAIRVDVGLFTSLDICGFVWNCDVIMHYSYLSWLRNISLLELVLMSTLYFS